VDDSQAPESYLVDGEWLPVTRTIEQYRGKSGELLATDTLRFSQRGPLRRIGGRWLSMRWTVLEAPNTAEPFLRAERATTAAEWMDAMSAYRAPAQNMLVADREGHISIRSTGWFPLRSAAGDGDGTRILDGSTSDNDWRGFWPVSQYPQSTDPPQGFLASANQQPLDPNVDERYLGADWYSPWRALEINQLLRADSSVTADEMRRYQTDPGSARADLFVPLLLDCASRVDDDSVAFAAKLLSEWDRRYTLDNRRAVLFEYIMDALRQAVWDELRPATDSGPRPPHTPGDMAMLALLNDSASQWWDRVSSEPVEQRDEIVALAMREGLARAARLHGDPAGDGWIWGTVRTQSIRNMLGIPGWSRQGITSQGGTGTINPVDGSSFGPSWRMVVELGPKVRAWGVYPGGQSGDPASPRYDDRIPEWSAGQLDTLRFPAAPDSFEQSLVRSRLTLTPGLN
jgi:penicillin amidase